MRLQEEPDDIKSVSLEPLARRLQAGEDDIKGVALDLLARRVLMASVIYYGLGQSVVPDDVFDKWCRRLAKRFDKLDRYRQWQLGSAEEIKASSFHVKITNATLGGAIAWLDALGMRENRFIIYTQEWKRSKRYQVQYLEPEHFKYQEFNVVGKPKIKKRKRVRL